MSHGHERRGWVVSDAARAEIPGEGSLDRRESRPAGTPLSTIDAKLRHAMAGLYAWWVRAADQVAARPRLALWLTLTLVPAALALVARVVLLAFPNSGDEYVYIYQAVTMAEGRLWNEAPLLPDPFLFNYIVFDGPRAYGSFPIGWPLMLAAAERLHVPLWLVNPLLGGPTVLLVAVLGTRLYSRRIGVIAALLVGSSSFFLFTSASFFSHTLCGVLLLGAACLAAGDDPRPAWVPVAIGFLIGWAVLARYLTGVIGALPLLCLLWSRRGRFLSTSMLVAIGGFPWVLVLAAYNQAMNGTPWKLTTLPLTVNLWFSDGFVVNGALVLASHLARLLLWAPPIFALAYAWSLRRAFVDGSRGLVGASLAIVAAVLYFYVELGGNQYGPRFYYEGFLLAAPFVAAHLFTHDRLEQQSPAAQLLAAGMILSIAAAPVIFVAHALVEHRVIAERTDVYGRVERSRLHQALVFVGDPVGSMREMSALDLTRNGVRFDGDVLYARDLGLPENCRAALLYPARQTWLYEWDVTASRGALRPLRCDAGLIRGWEEARDLERRRQDILRPPP